MPIGNGIPPDLLATYEENVERYAALGLPPPRHYDETVPGEVTVYSYAEPEVPYTFYEPIDGPSLVFEPVAEPGGPPVMPISFHPPTPVITPVPNAATQPDGSESVAITDSTLKWVAIAVLGFLAVRLISKKKSTELASDNGPYPQLSPA